MQTAALREDALHCFMTGIAAADPYRIVKNHLRFDSAGLHIGQHSGRWSRIHLIAFGKAACQMLQGALAVIPKHYLASPPLAVTTDDNLETIAAADSYAAGHPVPDQRGLEAAQTVIQRISHCQPGDLLLLLISGGGSALLPCPAPGISLADKTQLTALLLACGADINAINCVRKHCSQIKGGGLLRLANGADVHTLVLSDVINNDPSSIASGPSVADPTTFADAIAILQHHAIWEKTPDSIRQHLQQGAAGLQPETLKPDEVTVDRQRYTLLASNSHSLDAIIEHCQQRGYHTSLFSRALTGDAQQAAQALAARAKSLLDSCLDKPTALLAGGETTVTLPEQHGLGGRNQEMALAFALSAERLQLTADWCFLSGGSDGRDGPTDAAGAIVDHLSLQRMRSAGIIAESRLAQHDSYHALQASNDLLMTGATGTNIADLQILLLVANNQKNH